VAASTNTQTPLPSTKLRLDGALELGGVPERGEVVGDRAPRVGWADLPVGGEGGLGPGIGEEAVWLGALACGFGLV
jgi:hypothetical protein